MNERSVRNLSGVHPNLVELVERAWDVHRNFIVTEGLRTKERQAQLLVAGASRTMNSRHLTGHAVDLDVTVNGEPRWDWPLYGRLAAIMKQCATELGLQITWGGDWKNFKDGPHFEIDPKLYPLP